MERKALIFNVQKYNMYDGPGIRTIVFFKGCPLRCKWCANPEGLERKIQIMFKKNSCVNCGLCVDACPVSTPPPWSRTARALTSSVRAGAVMVTETSPQPG